MDEFARIANFFAPLSLKEPGAFSLTDDAALITPPPQASLVITQDTLVAGIHFIGNEPAHLIAQKALRVNLSDLAAKGAKPHAYFLSLSLPDIYDNAWIKDFVHGLKEDQERFAITLMGGDSTRTPNTLTITITAVGFVPEGRMLRRNSAKTGDIICVSGTLGDAYLGLQLLQNLIPPLQNPAHQQHLISRYQLPDPRLALRNTLMDHATSCIDLSDGLLQDLSHICKQSALGAALQLELIPCSEAAQALLPPSIDNLLSLATGGDDYELLFTLPPDMHTQVNQWASDYGIPLTVIGRMQSGAGIHATHQSENISLPSRLGYQHAR